jgi:hypothetical protein
VIAADAISGVQQSTVTAPWSSSGLDLNYQNMFREVNGDIQDPRFATTESVKGYVFCDTKPCSRVKVIRRFGGTYLYLQFLLAASFVMVSCLIIVIIIN